MNSETTYEPANNPANRINEGENYKKLFYLMLSKWHWFVIAIVLFLVAANFYLRYTPPTWQVTATVLIGEEQENQPMPGADQLMQGFGLVPGMQNIDNQLHILTSWSLVDQTLDELPFEVECYQRRLLHKVALYPESPIQVFATFNSKIPEDIDFKLKNTNKNTYELSAKSDTFKFKINANFGELIDIEGNILRIERAYEDSDPRYNFKKVYFVHHSRDELVEDYRSRFFARPVSRESTIIRFSLEGTNRRKDMAFLSRLSDNYIANNLERKNVEGDRTIRFIDDQLIGITDSLSITEEKLQRFRSRNRVMDISAQGEQIIDQAMNLENERARLVIESNYYEYLADYLSEEVAGELPVSPATMGITDPGLTRLVVELADLQSQYFSKGIGDKNPMQSQIAQQLHNIRNALNETVKGVRHANDLALRENSGQIRSINARAATLPRTERELLGIEREFKLNDELYSFLQQRKAEAQIQKASNLPDNEIIDRAKIGRKPIKPDPMKVYLIAFIAGLGLPFLSIITIHTLHNVIRNEDDIRKISDLPVAGHIPHSKSKGQNVIFDDPLSPLAESFRALRAKIQFFTQGVKSPVILVTSSMPDEGKSFTAQNLASIYSMMSKKTVLVGFDLRRPVVFEDIKIADEKGVSTWYIAGGLEIITKSSYLDILPSGPKPPNPAELIASAGTAALIRKLKERYDYIILDSAPIGTVSDSISLAQLADATIIMVRSGKTISPILANTIADMKDNGINGVSLLLNDIHYGKFNNRYYGRYKYDSSYFNKAKKTKKAPFSWFQ